MAEIKRRSGRDGEEGEMQGKRNLMDDRRRKIKEKRTQIMMTAGVGDVTTHQSQREAATERESTAQKRRVEAVNTRINVEESVEKILRRIESQGNTGAVERRTRTILMMRENVKTVAQEMNLMMIESIKTEAGETILMMMLEGTRTVVKESVLMMRENKRIIIGGMIQKKRSIKTIVREMSMMKTQSTIKDTILMKIGDLERRKTTAREEMGFLTVTRNQRDPMTVERKKRRKTTKASSCRKVHRRK